MENEKSVEREDEKSVGHIRRYLGRQMGRLKLAEWADEKIAEWTDEQLAV